MTTSQSSAGGGAVSGGATTGGQTTSSTAGSVKTGTTFNFTRNLTVGSRGEDVKVLQQFLNTNGFPVAATGIGSAGNETTYFGPATFAALQKWQAANGVSPASGYFGPLTRAKIQLIPSGAGGAAVSGADADGDGLSDADEKIYGTDPKKADTDGDGFPDGTEVKSGYDPLKSAGAKLVNTITETLYRGIVNPQVVLLQQILNANGFPVAVSGPGSKGSEVASFGALTEKAVQAFQVAKGIVAAGGPGYGVVGPKTRAEINKLSK